MEKSISESRQKYTYEDYYNMLKNMSIIVRKYRNESIKNARRNSVWQGIIDYPIKLLLGTSISGGGLEALGNLDQSQKWVGYTRTGLEIFVFILLSTKDFGQFEKKKQKYNQAAALLSSFHNIIQQQMKVKHGFEGNRDEIIKEFTETFEGIKGSNAIIQEFGIQEDIERANSSTYKKSVTFVDAETIDGTDSADTDAETTDVELVEMEEGRRKSVSSKTQRCNTALINDMMNRMV